MLPSVEETGNYIADQNTGKQDNLPTNISPYTATPRQEEDPEILMGPSDVQEDLCQVDRDVPRPTQPHGGDQEQTQAGGGRDDDTVERGGSKEDCSYSPEGVCSIHGQATKKFRTKRTWSKGRNGLFLWTPEL